MTAPPTDWHARARALRPRELAFIDGRWCEAISGERLDCRSPVDGRLLARVAACGAADVDRAVSAARRAFESGAWWKLAPRRRKQVLLDFAAAVRAAGEELALTETLDMGKPIADSLAVDVPATANCLQWFGEAIDKVYGEIAPTGDNVLATVTREPLGVVGAIVPWNFPMIMAAWKVGPALAAGNSVVLKPSEKSPLTALRLAELAVEAGLPPGVLNVVPGPGQTAGEALALHPDVDAIGFTGSTATGRRVMECAARSNLKRVGLELGGKSPNIVLPDWDDLPRAARAAAFAIFYNQGEMCTAGSRLLVPASLREPMLEEIARVARELAPGDPLDPATRLGAIVDEPQLERVMDYIGAGREEGARLVLGGERTRRDSGGLYVEPTVFDRVVPGMRIAREEIFGPVLSVIEYRDEDEALRIANDSPYGLAAAVWTRDLRAAHRLSRGLRSGMVYVNCYDADDITVPFGGFRQSGMGRDKSLHAFDKYTELKTTWIDLT